MQLLQTTLEHLKALKDEVADIQMKSFTTRETVE